MVPAEQPPIPLNTDLVPRYRGASSFSQVTVSFSVGSCLTRQCRRGMEPLFTTWSSGPLTILVGAAQSQKKSVRHHTAGSWCRSAVKSGGPWKG